MDKVYVVTAESGSYSDWTHAVVGVYSSYDLALASIPNANLLAVEQWDGRIHDEHRYTSGPENKDREGPYFEIEEWEIDGLQNEEEYPSGYGQKTPLAPSVFPVGTRVRAKRSKREATVVENRDWVVDFNKAMRPTYGREVILLPDDNTFIGRGSGLDGYLRAQEKDLELVPVDAAEH